MRKVEAGVNDFKTLHPDLMEEWNYEKNNKIGICPDSVLCGSRKKVWWKCKVCGHEWFTGIANRHNGTGCPNCRKQKRGRKIVNNDVGNNP